MDKYVEFLEGSLGYISRGWSKTLSGVDMPFQVVEYEEGKPFEGTITYSTLGFSNIALNKGNSAGVIRHELFLSLPVELKNSNAPAVLQQVGMIVLSKDKAYSRGDVIQGEGYLFEGYKFNTLYVSSPVYFPDDFHVYEGTETVVQISLFPIFDEEAKFIEANGWEAFEDILEQKEADLIDLSRGSMI